MNVHYVINVQEWPKSPLTETLLLGFDTNTELCGQFAELYHSVEGCSSNIEDPISNSFCKFSQIKQFTLYF